MKLDHIHNVYFLGIGGIGMSALARYFLFLGKRISGYDRVPSALTSALEKEGMEITYTDDVATIPTEIIQGIDRSLIVFTPAIPDDHKQFVFFKQKGFLMQKRAKVLGGISTLYKTIAVAGTHGKTTVSTLTTHLLNSSSVKCNAFLGGISKNFQSNLVLNDSDYMVAEADEYDRSFLQLQPYCGVITSVDPDHLDIYGSYESVQAAFYEFMTGFTSAGFLVMKKDLPVHAPKDLKVYTYHISDTEADFFASDIEHAGQSSTFTLHLPGNIIYRNLTLGIPGKINIENAIAASAIAYMLGVDESEIREGLAGFMGIHRRFDFQYSGEVVYIDDYAHHPAELKAFITSVRDIYPQRRLTGIFQPHLYSRTRDFVDEFSASLSLLDNVVLLPIYPAREKPIPGVTSKVILKKVTKDAKTMISKEDVLEYLEKNTPDILLTMGAGDIELLRGPIVNWLTHKFENKKKVLNK